MKSASRGKCNMEKTKQKQKQSATRKKRNMDKVTTKFGKKYK